MATLLAARNFPELVAQLRSIDPDVPEHPKDRKNAHVEIYSLVSLLGSIPWNSNCFPVEVTRRERPDFFVRCGARGFGLEHTEAINENLAKERALRADGHGPETHFLSHASVSDECKSRAKILANITNDDIGDGWVGDFAERGWAEAIAYFIDRKVASAKKDGYELVGDDRLVIYDSWPAPSLKHHIALPYLRKHLMSSSAWSVFSRVYILDEQTIVELSAREVAYHRVRR